ncbi:MAG: CvpA family protein [Acidithiobacillus sp.]|jgi:membrane protein required for colicin V production|uniref:CvpA family protein n=1 Tax=Acidithiobacillus sp. TaxID=1872118 RepID=UPI003D034E17
MPSWVNLAVLVVLFLSLLWGVLRGMLREFFSLLGWVGGVYVAWRYGAQWLAPQFTGLPAPWRVPLADFLLFLAVIFLTTLIAFLLRKILYPIGFSGPDRLLGGAFGLLRGGVILLVLMFVARAAGFAETDWWQSSWLGSPQVRSLSQSITAPAVSYWESQNRVKTTRMHEPL